MRYILRHEEAGDELGRAAGLTGFFGDGGPDGGRGSGWREFRLSGLVPTPELTRLLGRRRPELPNVEVAVADDAWRVVGAYYVGGPSVVEQLPGSAGETVDLLLNGLFFELPPPAAQGVWREWCRELPTRPGLWADRGPEERAAWLHVVRVHDATARSAGADKDPGLTYTLDAARVTDPVGFYCAIGEAVNGPGGYFGATLDGLADCLRGDFGARTPFRLVWRSSAEAVAALARYTVPSDPSRTFTDEALDILRQARVEVILD
ncbi:barstar family protein [Streptomyces avicenniae]|uniref:barstar family protein n=1 Tax=Streptomyces avicenniae TaxID=500153 RepID=UPI00069B8C9C|nr:barstar family protein [Streptomyces avicenniae]